MTKLLPNLWSYPESGASIKPAASSVHASAETSRTAGDEAAKKRQESETTLTRARLDAMRVAAKAAVQRTPAPAKINAIEFNATETVASGAYDE